jgi:hypothetical protein
MENLVHFSVPGSCECIPSWLILSRFVRFRPDLSEPPRCGPMLTATAFDEALSYTSGLLSSDGPSTRRDDLSSAREAGEVTDERENSRS